MRPWPCPRPTDERTQALTGFTRHTLPVEITGFAGQFASQPLAYAHLLDAAPALELEHVEVIQGSDPAPRLAGFFDPETVAIITAAATGHDTILLILPAAYPGLDCPVQQTEHLTHLGDFRGTITRLVQSTGG